MATATIVPAVNPNGTLRSQFPITGELEIIPHRSGTYSMYGRLSNVPKVNKDEIIHYVIRAYPFNMVTINGTTGGHCIQSGPLYDPYNVRMITLKGILCDFE